MPPHRGAFLSTARRQQPPPSLPCSSAALRAFLSAVRPAGFCCPPPLRAMSMCRPPLRGSPALPRAFLVNPLPPLAMFVLRPPQRAFLVNPLPPRAMSMCLPPPRAFWSHRPPYGAFLCAAGPRICIVCRMPPRGFPLCRLPPWAFRDLEAPHFLCTTGSACLVRPLQAPSALSSAHPAGLSRRRPPQRACLVTPRSPPAVGNDRPPQRGCHVLHRPPWVCHLCSMHALVVLV